MRRTAAVACAAALLLAACSNGRGLTSAPLRTTASASPSARAAAADLLPILHLGTSVKLGYVTQVNSMGTAEVTEKTTWQLTSVHYIPYAEAVAGGSDGMWQVPSVPNRWRAVTGTWCSG